MHSVPNFRRQEVAFAALQLQYRTAYLRPLLPQVGNFVYAETSVYPEHIRIRLGDIFSGIVEPEGVLGLMANVLVGEPGVVDALLVDVLVDTAPTQSAAVHAAYLVSGRGDAHLGAVVQADEMFEVVRVVACVGYAVPRSQRRADVGIWSDADLLGELGQIRSEGRYCVALASVIRLSMATLV